MMAKIPKSELGPLARESIDALRSGGDFLGERSAAIAAYNPSNQIEYIDAIRLKAMEQKFISEPRNIYDLFCGVIQNLDLNTRAAHKLVKAIFDCVNVLGGEHSDSVCMDIYIDLAANYESRVRNGKIPMLLDLRGLAEISGFIKGFEKSLFSDVHAGRLLDSKSLWMNFLPELVSRDSISISKESIDYLIRTIDSAPHEYPATIRLCRYPLSMANDKSLVLAGKDYERKSDTISVNSQAQTTAGKLLPEVAMLVKGVSGLAEQLSSHFEKRLKAQYKIIEEKNGQYDDLEEQYKKIGNDLNNIKKINSELRDKVKELELEIEKYNNDLDKTIKELNKYSDRHDAIVTGIEQKIADAELGVKRKFYDRQKTFLVSIRDSLSRLVEIEAPETAAKQAATNFNNFLRFLTSDKYIPDGEIARINTATEKRDGG